MNQPTETPRDPVSEEDSPNSVHRAIDAVPRFPRPAPIPETPQRDARGTILRFVKTTLIISMIIVLGIAGVVLYQYTQAPVTPDRAPTIFLNVPGVPVYAGETRLGMGPTEIALDGISPGTFRVHYNDAWDGLLNQVFPGCEHVAVTGPGESFEGVANGKHYQVDTSGVLIGYIDGSLEAVLFVRVHWTEESLMSCGFFRFPREPARTFNPKTQVRRSKIRSFLDRCFARASLDAIEITPKFNTVDQIPRRWQVLHQQVNWRLSAEKPKSR